ncbi:unnamed protein product [Amoebophrya sp. A120]|nr:unnamed protein product [Amoebophrya sp. A120]|eukprot:GSA120T00022183001.1
MRGREDQRPNYNKRAVTPAGYDTSKPPVVQPKNLLYLGNNFGPECDRAASGCFTDASHPSDLERVGCCGCDRSVAPTCLTRCAGCCLWSCGVNLCISGNWDGRWSSSFKLNLFLTSVLGLNEIVCNAIEVLLVMGTLGYDTGGKQQFNDYSILHLSWYLPCFEKYPMMWASEAYYKEHGLFSDPAVWRELRQELTTVRWVRFVLFLLFWSILVIYTFSWNPKLYGYYFKNLVKGAPAASPASKATPAGDSSGGGGSTTPDIPVVSGTILYAGTTPQSSSGTKKSSRLLVGAPQAVENTSSSTYGSVEQVLGSKNPPGAGEQAQGGQPAQQLDLMANRHLLQRKSGDAEVLRGQQPTTAISRGTAAAPKQDQQQQGHGAPEQQVVLLGGRGLSQFRSSAAGVPRDLTHISPAAGLFSEEQEARREPRTISRASGEINAPTMENVGTDVAPRRSSKKSNTTRSSAGAVAPSSQAEAAQV